MRDIWNEKCILSPSLICLDQCNLEQQVRTLEDAGIGMVHVDILDGHFSPSMPLGLNAVRQLRSRTNLIFDCHVMATNPDYFVDELLDMGAEQIVFQAETAPHLDGMLNRIHARGVRAGIALKPATPLSVLDYILPKCDTVLLMLINPGYAFMKDETQVPYADRKIRELRQRIREEGLGTKIEIDGRISPENLKDYGDGIVDLFVTGSTFLDMKNLRGSLWRLTELREAVTGGEISV